MAGQWTSPYVRVLSSQGKENVVLRIRTSLEGVLPILLMFMVRIIPKDGSQLFEFRFQR